jgi:hypothetical protein
MQEMTRSQEKHRREMAYLRGNIADTILNGLKRRISLPTANNFSDPRMNAITAEALSLSEGKSKRFFVVNI